MMMVAGAATECFLISSQVLESPDVSDSFFGCEAWRNVSLEGVVEGTDLHFIDRGPQADRPAAIAEDDLDAPEGCGGIVVAPLELRRDDVGWVDGAVEGDVDVQAGVSAVHGDGAEVFRNDAGIGGWGRVVLGRDRARKAGSGHQAQREGREKVTSHEELSSNPRRVKFEADSRT